MATENMERGRFKALYFSKYKMEHIPKGGRNKPKCQNGAPLTLCNGHVPEKLYTYIKCLHIQS